MILKRGGGKKYGIPYQGTKANIMPILVKMFPNAENFYDVFGGGFSVTHYMMEHRSKSYKHFHYNELRPGLCELIRDAIDGKYNFDRFRPDWISRERFMAEKESNAYIKIIWSFGNNGKNYIFGKEIESQKRSMHMAVVFDEFDNFMRDSLKIDKWPNQLSITGKRLYLKKLINGRIDMQQLEHLQQLQRPQQLERLEQLQQLEHLQQLHRLEQLQQLERLERLERLELTNLDYRQLEIKQNSVIYCDPPYKGTADYESSFNHKEFFDWAASQQNPLFISEYNVNDDRFFLLKEVAHRSTFSQSKNNPVVEKLYGNKIALETIQSFRSKLDPTQAPI